MGTQIGSCWGKVFGKEASTGGATSFRKAVVSAVHACEKEMRGDLADLMSITKRQRTGITFYRTRENQPPERPGKCGA